MLPPVLHRSRPGFGWSALLFCLIGLIGAAFCLSYGGPHGLAARVTAGNSATSQRSYAAYAAEPARRFVEEASAQLASTDIRIVWSGLIWVDQQPISRIGLATAGAARLSINGVAVIEMAAGVVHEEWASPTMHPGANLISLDYERRGGPPDLELRWAATDGAVHISGIDASAFSPGALTRVQHLARRWTTSAQWLAALAWLALLGVALVQVLRRLDGAAAAWSDWRVVTAMAFCAALFGVGITWGWPGDAWPPDELEPRFVLQAWQQRFSGGWHDKYPPGFYYLLSLLYAPLLVAEHFTRASTIAPPTLAILSLSGRLLNLMLSLGTIASIGLLTVRLGYRRQAWLAVMLAGTFLPMAFYAKTANVDAAYLFWFALSLVFLARISAGSDWRSFVGLGATVALAVATKDHAYSLYVLPGLYLLVQGMRGGQDAARPVQLLTAVASGLVVWTVVQNVAFNPEGFQGHIRTIVGPASSDYRVVESTLGAPAVLLRAVCIQVWQCLSWSGIAAVALGVAAASSARRPIPMWLWLTIPSSYVSFVAVVGYSYDRFLLPPTLVCAVPAALGIAGLLEEESAYHLKRLCGALLLAWIVLRAVGLDVLMVTDGRYTVERWLQREVSAGETVGSFSPPQSLPRLGRFTQIPIRPGIAETLLENPDFIVVNTEHLLRFAGDPVRMAWIEWLTTGTGPYREVFRYKAPVPWFSPLRFDARFTDRIEDPFTNLDKVNPEIVIFRR